MLKGTPPALPLIPAKLDRMSDLTTPVDVSTVGPFEPSPGYGPSVSCGMRLHVADEGGALVVGVVVVVVVVVGVAVAVGAVGESPHPTSCKAPIAAPNRAPRRSKPRRSMATL